MTPATLERTKVFVSYSHKDGEWLERLRVHLKLLERQYELDVWDDTRIKPGSLWREEISTAVGGAKAIILLVSADFLASDFIATEELPALLVAAKRNGADLFAVILSPSRFSSVESLSQFQTVNDPNSPLDGLTRSEREKVFVTLANLVELSLRQRQATASPTDGNGRTATVTAVPRQDCHDYADIFDIHIKREQSKLSLARVAVMISSLVGLALLLSAWLVKEFRESTVIGIVMLLTGIVAIGLSFYILKTVTDKSASIESCRFVKRRFSVCHEWSPSELRENIQLAKEFLKGMLRS
jgi:hypothetical protein